MYEKRCYQHVVCYTYALVDAYLPRLKTYVFISNPIKKRTDFFFILRTLGSFYGSYTR
jgi:hypothetical protein